MKTTQEIKTNIDRMEDEHNRTSGDIDTTVDNSVDSDNVVSKMTIPIIEVDEEIAREIDEYLSKQDGYREVRNVNTEEKADGDRAIPSNKVPGTRSDNMYDDEKVNSFIAYGFETPDFEGEILKEVDGWLIGYIIHDDTVLSAKWSKEGTVLTRMSDSNKWYNLTPIKKHWYDDPLNFPVRLVRDTEQYATYRWVYKREDFTKAHRQGFKLVTQDDCSLARSMF